MSSMSSSDTSPMRYVLPPVGAAVWTSTLTLNILGLATPLVMLQLFDRIIPFQSHETLKMLVAGLCCVAAVELFQRMLRVRILIDQAKSEFTTLNAKLTERVVKADPIALTNTSSVSLFAQLQSASGIRDLISSTGRLHIIEVPFSAIAIASIWLIGGALILVPVIGLGILVLLGLFVRHQQKYLIEERTEADRARYDLLSNALKKISVVKSSQMEVGLKTMYRRLQLSSAKASHAAILSSGLFQNASLVIGQAFSSAMVLTGAYFVITGRIGAAELAACTMLNGRAVQPALQLIKVWASGETTDAIRRHASEGLLLPAAPRGLSNKRQLSGAIAFEDVTVRTSRSGRAVLRSLSFAVPENGFAWVESNSGASTTAMMHVLMGQTVPEKGQVLIDNRPPRSLMTHRGCGGLVYINEDPTIFDGTILENVACGTSREQLDAAYMASNLVGLDSHINSLPLGFDTQMRESGLHLASKGLLQRLNVARALVQAPKILLFDDAMNALDVAQCSRVRDALETLIGNTTVIAYDSTRVLKEIATDHITLKTASASSSALRHVQRIAATESLTSMKRAN